MRACMRSMLTDRILDWPVYDTTGRPINDAKQACNAMLESIATDFESVSRNKSRVDTAEAAALPGTSRGCYDTVATGIGHLCQRQSWASIDTWHNGKEKAAGLTPDDGERECAGGRQ